MSEKISTLLSDVSIEGDIVEKDKIIIDAKINGDIKAQEIHTHSKGHATPFQLAPKAPDHQPGPSYS